MIRTTALLLTVLTGFAGLVYEVTWQKYLAALLGSHGEATAAVLAIFLGGLSAGYALFGRATRQLVERARRMDRPPRLLTFYALVEAGIGAYGLLFPWLFGTAQHLSLLGPSSHDAMAFAFDVVLSALLIGPPTILMGGTIPVLTLALAGDLQHATRVHAWVYGFNTVGAFAGALFGVFFLMPQLGLDGTVALMGCINILAALGFAGLERSASRVAPDLAEPSAAEPVPRFSAWAGIALLAGFAMMALQTTLNRIGALVLGSSHFTFAMVVAVFVLCIAVGSLAVSLLPRIPRACIVGSQWALVGLLFPIYLVAPDATYWAYLLRVRLGGPDAGFYAYQLAVFLITLAVLALPIGLSGALLPLLFHELRREVRDLGAVAGRLYAWNTVGSLLGALLGGYLLLLWLDLHHIYRIAMACIAVGAGALTLLVWSRVPRFVPALAVTSALAAITLLPPWTVEHLIAGAFRERDVTPATFLGPDAFFEYPSKPQVIFYDDDPVSTVSVGRQPSRPTNLALRVNGKPEGSLVGDYPTMALLALVPSLIADDHQSVFVIGLGTGVTTGELAALEATRKVTVAEISRAVIAANPLFDAGNLGASKSPKVEVMRGDAFRTLLRSAGQYDVIVSEPSNPWVAGVEMLYSREFLEAARSRLAPGGAFAQWFHLYETDEDSVKLVLRTYASVFPNVSVWLAGRADLLILGLNRTERALDPSALEARFSQPDFAAGFKRVGITEFTRLLVHELIPLGTLHAEELEGPIHSLRRPILSDWAARAFFRGNQVVLPPYLSPKQIEVALGNSLLRRYAGDARSWTEEVREATSREICRFAPRSGCATFFARWTVDDPDSPRLKTTLAQIRRNSRRRNPKIEAPWLQELGALYGGAELGESDSLTPEEARDLTRRFIEHYYYAVPFDRRMLESTWDRCRGEGCEAERLQAERSLRGRDGR
ncbi:MAG TPA: fused MFS/spermidine synthase [Myxococcota bacterium]